MLEQNPSARLLHMQSPEQMRMIASPVDSREIIPRDPELGTVVTGPCFSSAAACICCPNILQVCGWCTQLNQNEQKAVMYWGQYFGTIAQPGLYCLNPWGRELKSVSTKYATLSLKDVKIVDARGNPVIMSGVVTYALVSAKRASLDVDDPVNFIRLQATAAMKQIAARYPYSAGEGMPSLQTEGAHLSGELVDILQAKVTVAGAVVHNFELVDLSYAPEIAQVMLVKQQAEALVEARRLIVGAAVDMAVQAITQLESKGTKLSDNARERVTSNLLAVICSHSPANPTVPVSSS
mmetsp:Transcript_42626/g.84739  ORF Transcript_42626/g.84739 Transcript_42626/m.84739 type:complete len:294 (-) Transcript_42626:294-1175(-)